MFSSFPSRRCMAIGAVLMMGTSGAWAYSAADEISALNNVAAQQTSVIEKHRAEAVAHILNAMPALSDKQVSEMANALLANPVTFSALQSLDGGDTVKLFAQLAALLQGKDLTPDHFDSFLSQIKDASTLQSLGIDSVRDLISPESERVIRQPTSDASAQPSTTTASATNPPSTTVDYEALIKELKAVLEDVEIESKDGTAADTGSITQTIFKNVPIIQEQLKHHGGTEAVKIWIKSLFGTLSNHTANTPEANATALKQYVEDANFLLGLITPTDCASDTQQTGASSGQSSAARNAGCSAAQQAGANAATQAINDATRRNLPTATPTATSTTPSAPAPAKTCYIAGGVTMCH